jgi:hypothetical protein
MSRKDPRTRLLSLAPTINGGIETDALSMRKSRKCSLELSALPPFNGSIL